MKNLLKLLLIRLVVNLADSIFYVVTLWYINDNYSSSFLLGIFVAINYLPDIFLVFLGPIIDRSNPRKVLFISILTQLTSVILFLAFRNTVPFSWMMLLVFTSVLASSISYVIEDVLIPQIVEYNQIIFANSLFSISYKVLDSLFNALSSVLQAMLGLILLLKVNIGIFVIALVLILFFDFNSKGNLSSSKFNIKIYKNEMIEGAKYIIHNDLLLRSAQLLLLINFFNSFQTVVVPIISMNFFNGPIFYGAFLTVTGIGGIFGNILSPIIAKYLRPNQIIGIFLCMNAISWMLAITIKNYIISLFLFFLCYLSKGVYNIIFNSIYQQIPPKKMLARVNTTIDSFISVGMPLGSIIAGIVFNWNIELISLLIGLPYLISGVIFYNNKALKKFEIM